MDRLLGNGTVIGIAPSQAYPVALYLGADATVPCHAVEAVTTYQAGIFRRHPFSSLERLTFRVNGHPIITLCGH